MESLFEINAQVNYKMTVENMRKFGIGPRPATVVVTSILFLFTLLFSAATGILAKGWKVYTIFGAGLLLTFFLPKKAFMSSALPQAACFEPLLL